jgi:broad specificity phosphatase PhoE
MEQLILVRHGATRANLERPYWLQGKGRDEPLAPEGLRQAEQVRDFLRGWPVSIVVSSPLRRARQTAETIAAPRDHPVRVLEALHEGDVGRWEGLTWEEIRATERDYYEQFVADPAAVGYPGGENFRQVAARVRPVLLGLFADHPGQTVVVVGHQITHRAFLGELLGLPAGQARRLKMNNGGLCIVRREAELPYVHTLNFTGHLEGFSATPLGCGAAAAPGPAPALRG